MKKYLILLIGLLITAEAYSQTNWRTKLKEELVTVENGAFSIDDTQEIIFKNGSSINMQTTATGDMNIINRDNFISIYSNVSVFMVVSILGEAGLSIDDVEFKDVENPTETPAIKIHMGMTENGIELIITTEDGDEKQLMSWEEFFADS